MNSITVLSILMLQLAVKGAFAASLTTVPGLSTIKLKMTTDAPQKIRPITPPPPPSPPPAPPASLFSSANGSTVAPPTSMTPVRTTNIVPTITISSLVPNSPSSPAPSVSMVTKPSPTPGVATTPGDGDKCEKENDCEQVCVNTPDGHECQCFDGYRLWRDKTSCQDIDECNSIYNDCPVNTKCVNSVGTYSCECVEGYKKNSDGDCVDVDECSEVTRPCPLNSVCENTVGSYICNCNDGYFKNGDSCTNIDYCEMGNDCEQICNDDTSSFTCDCYPGYTLNSDGKTCTDDGKACSLTCINGYCVAGLRGDSCRCSPGYEIKDDNSTVCVDINECVPTTLPEIPFRKCKSLCENSEGSYKCSCFNGQIQGPDERTCIDIDECADDALNDCAPPSEGGNCTNLEGARRYTCSCQLNYQGNGRTCNVMDFCSDNPCEGENYICENYPGGRRCLCEPGFYISEDGTCKKAEKTYATVLVMNGPQDIFTYELEDKASVAYLELALEIQESLDYEFEKKYGSAFLRCTVESFESGSIVANVATFFNSEFKGDVADLNNFLQDEAIYCSKNICSIGSISNIDTSKSVVEDFDECATGKVDTCLPRSTCVNEVGSYRCACEEGFRATYSDDKQVFCEDLNECEQDPYICFEKSDSFCVNTFGSYECQCEPSFKDISGICASVCDIKECENGATCIISNEEEIPEAYCMCPPGYEGEKCSERSHLFKVAVGVGTTFIILSGLLFVSTVLLTCINQPSKTYPDEDQSIDGGWDESKDKNDEDMKEVNGGHINVVMIAGDKNTETGVKYVSVQKEGPNGTALSTLNQQPSGSTTKIQVEPNSYF